MFTPILKEQAIAAYGNGVKLARALGVTPSAVYQWADNAPIPDEHGLRLRYVLKPEVFGVPSSETTSLTFAPPPQKQEAA